jgi:hypothetical protein
MRSPICTPHCWPPSRTPPPHATAERRRELRIQAVKQARQKSLFFDLTISFSKSISTFHASLGENARQAGHMIWEAAHVGFEYFQRDFTRMSWDPRMRGGSLNCC